MRSGLFLEGKNSKGWGIREGAGAVTGGEDKPETQSHFCSGKRSPEKVTCRRGPGG